MDLSSSGEFFHKRRFKACQAFPIKPLNPEKILIHTAVIFLFSGRTSLRSDGFLRRTEGDCLVVRHIFCFSNFIVCHFTLFCTFWRMFIAKGASAGIKFRTHLFINRIRPESAFSDSGPGRCSLCVDKAGRSQAILLRNFIVAMQNITLHYCNIVFFQSLLPVPCGEGSQQSYQGSQDPTPIPSMH